MYSWAAEGVKRKKKRRVSLRLPEAASRRGLPRPRGKEMVLEGRLATDILWQLSTIQEIESAIERLPSNERWDLFHRLQDLLWREWDRQIEADHQAGHLDELIAEVRSDISAGRLKALHEVFDDQ